ncbi:MAG: phosphoribosylformylglycinamidine synthase subunit PurS [Acidimicrobiales bacterium]
MRFDVRVEVRLRPGIADPAGATVERALPALGFAGVEGVRMGKVVRFTVEAADAEAARVQAADMCGRLLANPVIEDAAVEVTAA